jgi:hypothetical protein
MTSRINDATTAQNGTSNNSLAVALDLNMENRNLSPWSRTASASTPANERLLDSFLEIPPLTFAPPKEIRAAKTQQRVQSVIGGSQRAATEAAPARPPVANETACKNSARSRTRTVSSADKATSETEHESVPGIDRFDRLLESISRVADGALKDLHFAALEGILSADMPVEKIQSLLPEAGKQFCELFQDAEQGGKSGSNTLTALREFQSLLTNNFDVKMEMSDRGLLVSEKRAEELESAWVFVPASGSIESGVQAVGSGRSADSTTVLSTLRNKLSSAIDVTKSH